jgi:hypothetical protein
MRILPPRSLRRKWLPPSQRGRRTIGKVEIETPSGRPGKSSSTGDGAVPAWSRAVTPLRTACSPARRPLQRLSPLLLALLYLRPAAWSTRSARRRRSLISHLRRSPTPESLIAATSRICPGTTELCRDRLFARYTRRGLRSSGIMMSFLIVEFR